MGCAEGDFPSRTLLRAQTRNSFTPPHRIILCSMCFCTSANFLQRTMHVMSGMLNKDKSFAIEFWNVELSFIHKRPKLFLDFKIFPKTLNRFQFLNDPEKTFLVLSQRRKHKIWHKENIIAHRWGLLMTWRKKNRWLPLSVIPRCVHLQPHTGQFIRSSPIPACFCDKTRKILTTQLL